MTETRCVQIDDIFPFKGSDISSRGNDTTLSAGFETTNEIGDKFSTYWFKKLANSPAEYFANKKKILAAI